MRRLTTTGSTGLAARLVRTCRWLGWLFWVGVWSLSAAQVPSGVPLSLTVTPQLQAPIGRARGNPTSPSSASTQPFDAWLALQPLTRTTSLADLGFEQPLLLSGMAATRTLYFPVPARAMLRDVQLDVVHNYVHSEQHKGWLSLAVGPQVIFQGLIEPGQRPRVATGLLPHTETENGFLPVVLGLQRAPRPGGKPGDPCDEEGVMPASLLIHPSTRIRFSYHPSDASKPADAWALLPNPSVVLMPGGRLAPATYDAAWRVGAALVQQQHRPAFEPMPRPGDEVDTALLQVPGHLKGFPVFDRLAKRRVVRLDSEAEVLAWLLLRLQATPSPAVLLVDEAHQQLLRLGQAQMLALLAAQRPLALANYRYVVDSLLAPVLTPVATDRVVTQALAQGPLLVVFPPGSQGVAQLGDRAVQPLTQVSGWRGWPALALRTRDNAVTWEALGMGVGPLALQHQAEWSGRFAASHPGLAGRTPKELVLDVAVPPRTEGLDPVVSVYFNDMLLVSRRLQGLPEGERVRVGIPQAVVRSDNVVRAVFVRQHPLGVCGQGVEALPLTVLPSSHVTLGKRHLSENFSGVSAAFAGGGRIVVPSAYLDDAVLTLPRVLWASQALALGADQAEVQVGDASNPALGVPPFLAMDVAQAGNPNAGLGDVLMPAHQPGPNQQGLRVGDLTSGAVIRVHMQGGIPSAVLQSVGQGLDPLPPAARLTHGNMAVVDQRGQLLQWDAEGRTDAQFLEDIQDPWVRRHLGWVVPLLVVLAFVALLYAASVRRRRSS